MMSTMIKFKWYVAFCD